MRQVIQQIIKQLVIESPYTDCFQLQSFMILHELNDLLKPNADKMESDYYLGTYWNRTYVNQGKQQKDLCVEYPLVGLEQKRAYKETWEKDEITYEFFIIVADSIYCDIRNKKCIRTPETVQDTTYNYLCNLVKELYRFAEYSIILTDMSTETIWSTDDRLDHMVFVNEIVSYNKLTDSIALMINEFDTQEITTWGIGIENVLGASATLRFTCCLENQVEWDIKIRDNQKDIPSSQCTDC